MPNKLIHFAEWIWQDYTGAKWSEINKANTHAPTGDSAYCTVKGKDSKSNYRPKSLFYHYQIGGIDSSKYKLNSVTFTLVLGRKCSNKVNPLPSIKCFVGDNNAPYRKEPLCTVSTYSLKKLEYDFDTYIIEYKLSNVTIADLKNLIVEVDWKRSLINGDSTVRVNRARVNVDYELKTPKWSIYDWMAEDTFWDNETTDWKITAKNTGYKGDGEVDIVLPKGVTLVSSRGEGSFNPSTLKWTFNANKNKTRSRYFKLKFTTVGNKTLTANNVKQPVNKKLTRDISVIKSQPKPQTKDDTITYTVYDYFANEEWQYFDVQINGVARNHPTEIACFPISMTPNCTLYTPLVYPNVYLLSESSDTVYQISGSYNDRICLRVEPNEDFEAHLRIFFKCDDSSDTGTVYMTANGTIFSKEFPINAPRKNIFVIDDSENISRDKAYVVNSVNIGATDMWTIRSKFARHNFFDDKKDLMEVEIEPMIAYIGVVPLSRCHKADVTADSKNSLIENRYLNRAYYGKKGDYSEDIKMTLRIAWYDVATLQGLVEMDKPIPIDTIPHFPDGDPLNHRGWAEIYEVTNIKKINDLYYECDVGVKYLSHDINTRFSITETKKITEANIKYYLALIHNYNEDLLDIFTLNYYEFWTTLEDANGDMIGTYDIEPQANLKMNRDLNRYSTYDIVYRNTLPMLMSEDYDGNWEMAIRVLDKSDGTMLFEHSYNNFKHYDYDTDYAVNTADATSKYLNGSNYDTLNFEKVGLGYDNLAPLLEDRKIATHFNTMESVVIDDPNEQFEMFLLDSDNKGIPSQVVNVTVKGMNNYSNQFNVMTDKYGRILFDVKWGNDTFDITLKFNETDTYRSCTYSTVLTLNWDYEEYHFVYPTNVTAYVRNYPYIVTLLDSEDNPVTGAILYFSFKTMTGDYGYERKRVTDENGQITIPIDWVNGSLTLKVAFKGDAIHQPVMFEEPINVNITTKETYIESNDVVGILGYKAPNVSCILKDSDGNPLSNKRILVGYYNGDVVTSRTDYTDEFGVLIVKADLVKGAWKIDFHFDGDDEYRPSVTTVNVTIENFEQLETHIESMNYNINEDEVIGGTQDYYTILLLDSYNNPVVNEPVSITIYKDNDITPTVDMVLKTDEVGMIKVPYLDNNCNATIISEYMGCTRYEPCTNEDIVTFEEVGIKGNVEFRVNSSHTYLEMKYGNGEWNDISTDNQLERIIINHPNDYRYVADGLYYYESMYGRRYKVTLFFKGNSNFYSKCITLDYLKVNDSRKSYSEWIALQPNATSYAYFYHSNIQANTFNHFTMDFDWEVPYGVIEILFGVDSSDWSDDLYEEAESFVKTVPTYYQADDGHTKTKFDFYGIMPSNGQISVWIKSTDFLKRLHYIFHRDVTPNSNTDIVLTQNGFAEDNETHQNIKVLATDPNVSDVGQHNNWFYMKLLNLETLEELYYQSYYIDNVTPVNIDFELEKSLYDTGDNWELEITSKESSGYKGAYLRATGRIDVDSDNPNIPNSIFTNAENYIELEQGLTFTQTGFTFDRG